jgi:plastocyanin
VFVLKKQGHYIVARPRLSEEFGRMRRLIGVLALLSLACGGEKAGQSPATPSGAGNDRAGAGGGGAAPSASTPAPQRAPGTVYEVKMEMVKGKYFFDPSSLTIKPGDGVRWVNINGGPHNVQFKKDRIPPGAQAVLNASMPDRIQDLTGPFMKDSLATFVVSFVNAPAGTYAYSCQPHELLGMVGTVTVSP